MTPEHRSAPEPRIPHVIVVGGGLAGLVTARELLNGGARVTLLEASSRLGGKVASHTVDGIRLDAGAESFATRGGTVAALITELGLSDDIVPPAAAGAWLLSRTGKALPLPKAGLLGIPSVPLARDVIAIVGLVGAVRAQLDGLLLGFVGARERNLGSLVRKRMGRAVLDRLVTPVAGAIHSVHPDQLDVDVVAPRLRDAVLSRGSLAAAVLTLREAAPAGAAVQGISGGVFRLVDALADSISVNAAADILLRSTVTAVDPTGVTLGDGQRIDGDHVVVAAELGPGSGVNITLATLVVRCAELASAPRGTGVLVAPGAVGVQAKALTHATAKWAWLADAAEDRQVLRLSYETAPDSDDVLREQARADAEVLLGVKLPAESVVAFARQTWAGPRRAAPSVVAAGGFGAQTESGELSTPADASDASHPVLEVGERVSGTGLAAVIRHSRAESENLLTDLASRPGLRLAPPS
ncbi:MAG: FAD-dependent oxidoreductase [Microbacteriaceae bacterium]|nr:FAD-dependent oxidoreductase [Microbacteriaceae bacterium]